MADSGNLSGMQNVTPVSTCPIFPDNPNQCTIIINVRRVFASISLIGCLFIILVIWLFRKYIAFSQRLILYMSVAALNISISYLMGELHPDGPLCDFQAFWMSFFDWSVLLWVSCITLNLFINVVWGKTTEKYEWLYHLVSWGISLFMSLLPFIGNHYGPAGAWCWIKDDWRWRVGIWYGPLFGMLLIMVVAYIYISCVLSRKAATWEGTYDPDTERKKQMLKEDIKPLMAYPFVYLATSLFPLINRIQNAVNSGHPVFALVLLASISSPSQGAINAVVFGLDRETFRRLTPSQIKMAWSRHINSKVVHEFPIPLATTDMHLLDSEQHMPLLR
ncbi:uncharacterized protein LOC123556016 isoform X1 [Mercenaria mercenaria]|uniref:uncharacterized protein LOC123556016 isoform X1 n=1 Tax=Mercenaria mercenaria TaxID=6596 RepID=UPI00234E9385|nr:uncharacterized protein LOC123556016 isoform X1 [Mercenaria mercenaria]